MDRQIIASGLLRDLWRIYDHGGHSMRSTESQLLETDWPYTHGLLENVKRPDFYEFLWNEEASPPIPEQYLLFPEIIYMSDLDARYLVLTGLICFYEQKQNFEEYPITEHDLVHRAAEYAGLDPDATHFRAIVNAMDPYDLISDLRWRTSRPIPDY